ncbi:MAG: Methyltransferase FkbM family [Candidatus Azambacteria bacterium GW2011_GWC2_45_7b]|uniref:Methyltransferase FkbM family n=3 Tax=Parcubacteria group TaxID=1794811 RepID=A0A837III1_9BACT|nr:MAG: Methyltransferase FkbM family [Parcubacteria group bacterium GW2011_GWC1_44_10]KKT60419.1 MAG: Methyltransferase FkbM family [Candidatus Giovannonibacteria bacterium GW2011_GWA1_44_25]KKU12195.1 MAG: Methyltransferase FkbM family [Candidatus Azambacteria bacterium GW2011_GWC2_45_7b]KKU30277.1 MAG: Methyltransferase FkbM family [Candidatus Giovannonibacteria bacterium GW2011_GWB1_46_20]
MCMTKRFKTILKPAINFLTDTMMKLARFSFPAYYNWRWKWQMLLWRYEPETVDFFKKNVKPGMTVVDIGAHIGYFARVLSKLVGRAGAVYAFEPDEANFKMLKSNTEHLKNVKTYQLAVSDRRGSVDFYLSGGRSGNHSTIAGVVLDQKKVTVEAVDLDSFFVDAKIQRVDFIKMDIEGGEPAALAGMKNVILKSGNIILVSEFAPAWLRKAGVEPLNYLNNLRALGFEISADRGGEILPFNPTESEMQKLAPSYFTNIYCNRH